MMRRRARGWLGRACWVGMVLGAGLCTRAAAAQLARFSLVDIDIRLVAAAVSDFTRQPVKLAPEVRGKVTLVTRESVDAYEATTRLFALAQDGGWQPEIDAEGRLSIRAARFDDSEIEVVQRMHRLRGASVVQVAPRVRALLSAQGRMGAPDDARLLVIDIPKVHAQIARLLAAQAKASDEDPADDP